LTAAGTLALVLALSWAFFRASGRYAPRVEAAEREWSEALSKRLSGEFLFVEPALLRRSARWALWASMSFSLVLASPWPLLAGLLLAWALPIGILRSIVERRRCRFERQFGDALPRIAAVLRAGHPLERAFASLLANAPDPLGQEVGLVLKEVELGAPLPVALENLLLRFPDADLRIFVRAVGVSRRAGSNLAEAIDRVSETVRDRRALRDRLTALTAQGRMQARVASLMPVFLAAGLALLDPAYLAPLLSTGWGKFTLLVCGLMLAGGTLWVHRISRAEPLR
jgi:tight adherence protein B